MVASTRTFILTVNEGILPISRQKKPGFNAIQRRDGTYFNTKARIVGSQMVQMEYMTNFDKFINDAITTEARHLQQFWYNNVNKYFNRRAFGMYYYHSNTALLFSIRRFRGKYSNRKQFKRREHTGQLKRALTIRNKNTYGCELYVRPCYAKTGVPVDYVNILMNGARPQPKPYIPTLDRRVSIKGKYWGGISRSYWATWQSVFEKQVRAANTRLNHKIEQYVVSQGIMERKDMRRAAAVSPLKKEISKTRETQTSRPSRQVSYQASKFTSKRYTDILRKFTP